MNIDIPDQKQSTEDRWLAAAYDLLTEQGVEAVKIMPLAKQIGVSRSGFYWHFKTRSDLLEAMIRRWEDKNTGNLVAQCEAFAENICEAMFNLFDCWLSEDLFDARLDLAIRNWARNDPKLHGRVVQADRLRQEAISAMFRRFGYDERQAHVRAGTVMFTQVGYISMQVFESLETRLQYMPDYVEVYTGQVPTQTDIRRFRARHIGGRDGSA